MQVLQSRQDILLQATRKPTIEIYKNNPDFIKFKLSDSDVSFANALRRIILVETPTLAIEVVKVIENTSVFHDEFIAHRLGLVPIHSATVNSYQNPRECICVDYCENCSIDYSLKVSNPSHSLRNMDVTSRDLIPLSFDINMNETDVQNFPPVALGFMNCEKEKAVLITSLKPGQSLNLICKARKGIGKEHAKWQPCATVSMQMEPVVKINKIKSTKLSSDERKEIVASCPRKVFKTKPALNGEFIDIEDAWKCIQCGECTSKAAHMSEEGFLRVSVNETCFMFTVETSGSLLPLQIVNHALKQLDEKLRNLQENLQSISFEQFE